MRGIRISISHYFALATFVICVVGMVAYPRDATAAQGLAGTQFHFFQKPPAANNLKMGTLEGKKFSLADLKGKVVLLNFWRKDCQYCTREKGYLKKLVKDIGRPDLEAVCVNLWDNPEWIAGQYGREPGGALLYATRPDNRPWVMENRVRGQLMGYYVLNEANEAIYEIKGFPSTYVIDKDGRVVASHLGMVEWTNPPVLSWLLGLLRAPNARQSVETAEYALPDWIDRLLSNNVVDQDALSGTAIRRANLAPRK